MLSEKSLAQFKEIWKLQFNEELDDAVASEQALFLLNLFRSVYGDITPQEQEDGK